ncbi:hypothetical protein BD324DRAFT_609701 [Kockovaella imperatae]|uniref:Uncharacterized protein n=1 Tax=Kockovaella imperatae TaxID=4999 RepID=A0A1Y1UA89_9TREE|nr:hypothetical protein BD324DRAFT_609701 [Kockovaella imperatae]ORX34950.1 hypothetical protein BD324DRAFT_609701 [Kockovaella imperatae]
MDSQRRPLMDVVPQLTSKNQVSSLSSQAPPMPAKPTANIVIPSDPRVRKSQTGDFTSRLPHSGVRTDVEQKQNLRFAQPTCDSPMSPPQHRGHSPPHSDPLPRQTSHRTAGPSSFPARPFMSSHDQAVEIHELRTCVSQYRQVRKRLSEELESERRKLRQSEQVNALLKSSNVRSFEVRQLTERLSARDHEIGVLQAGLLRHDAERLQIQDQLKAAEARNEELARDLDSAKTLQQRAENDLSDVVQFREQEKEAHDTENSRLNGLVRSLRDDGVDNRAEIAQLRYQLQQLEDKLDDQKLQTQHEAEAAKLYDRQRRCYLASRNQAQRSQQEVEGELAWALADVDDLRSILVEQVATSAAESSIEVLQREKIELQNQLESTRLVLKEKYAEVKTYKDDKATELRRREQDHADWAASRRELEAVIAELRAERDGLGEEMANLKVDAGQRETQHQSLAEELKKAQLSLGTQADRIRTADLRWSQAQRCWELVKIAYRSMSKANETLKRRNSHLVEAIHVHEEECLEMQSKADAVLCAQRRYCADLEEKSKQLAQARVEIESLWTALRLARGEHVRLLTLEEKAQGALEGHLEEAEKVRLARGREIAVWAEKLKAANEKLASQSEQLETTSEALANTKKQVIGLGRSLDKTNGELDLLRNHHSVTCADLTSRISSLENDIVTRSHDLFRCQSLLRQAEESSEILQKHFNLLVNSESAQQYEVHWRMELARQRGMEQATASDQSLKAVLRVNLEKATAKWTDEIIEAVRAQYTELEGALRSKEKELAVESEKVCDLEASLDSLRKRTARYLDDRDSAIQRAIDRAEKAEAELRCRFRGKRKSVETDDDRLEKRVRNEAQSQNSVHAWDKGSRTFRSDLETPAQELRRTEGPQIPKNVASSERIPRKRV